MDRQLPTLGQLERNLSQSIQKLYRQELEHSPQKVTCKLFKNNLSIVIEDALTAVEATLVDEDGNNNTVKNLSQAIKNVIKSKLKNTIETVLAVKVDDILFDSNIETRRAAAIVILQKPPLTRSLKLNPKIRDRSKDETDVELVEENSITSTTELIEQHDT